MSRPSFFTRSSRLLTSGSATLTASMMWLIGSATQVAAQTTAWTGSCVGSDSTVPGSSDVPTILGLECLLANVLRVAVSLIGLAGFIMLLVGSYRYLVSGGNSKGTETARNTLTYALVGLVVALSALLIVNLIAEFTGVNEILNFRLWFGN